MGVPMTAVEAAVFLVTLFCVVSDSKSGVSLTFDDAEFFLDRRFFTKPAAAGLSKVAALLRVVRVLGLSSIDSGDDSVAACLVRLVLLRAGESVTLVAANEALVFRVAGKIIIIL